MRVPLQALPPSYLKVAHMNPFGERTALDHGALLHHKCQLWHRPLLYNLGNPDILTRVAIPMLDTRQPIYRILPTLHRTRQLNPALLLAHMVNLC